MKVLRSKYLDADSLKHILEEKYNLRSYPISKYITNYLLFAGNLETLNKIPKTYGFIHNNTLYIHPDALLKHAKKEWKALIRHQLTRKTSENSGREYLQ
jgi:hypothetical protein